MNSIVQEQDRADRARREKFGEGRPAIHADFKGQKFVAVGDQLLHSDKWRTFPDFLQDYIKHALDPVWGKAELAKPLEDRHQILKWYDAMCRYQRTQQRGPDGLYGVAPNGGMRAYLLLAYDLYTLRHHSALQSVVVKRLKHRDQFQGARHELFAAATCIRASYDIEYEDEGDNSRRHAELIASHGPTGQKVTVEAKSKHRDGVLGFRGKRKPDDEIRVGIQRLLRDALGKPAPHPYVIFFDLNLPPTEHRFLDTQWFREVGDSVADEGGDADSFNLIVLSNQPDHYLDEDVPARGGEIVSVMGRNPRTKPVHMSAIAAIHDAANKFGVIPNSFEEAG